MVVEVLTFEGCPQAQLAAELARGVIVDLGIEGEIRLVYVTEAETRERRFLGSPTLRVNGQDVEPGAELRRDFAHSCRLYQTSAGPRPLPDAAWIHKALGSGH